MTKYLVIVESPAKCKTIQKYLGNDYEVLASYGHVRDLPPRKGSVNPDQDFAMTYSPIERNARHIELIAKALKKGINFKALILKSGFIDAAPGIPGIKSAEPLFLKFLCDTYNTTGTRTRSNKNQGAANVIPSNKFNQNL